MLASTGSTKRASAFFLAWAAGVVVGMCGINIDPYLDDLSIGRLRHMYVYTSHRRFGVGDMLVEATKAAATGQFQRLRFRAANSEASLFYQTLGFDAVAEDQATHSWTCR